MQNKPNLFIVGPPKCATSSLYYYLSQHPEIYLSSKKETRFFDLEFSKGIDFYENTYFSSVNNEKVIGEATATYSFLPFVADRIKEYYPNAKFIFCFRDPVDRAFSEWLMRRNRGVENLKFLEAIRNENNQGLIDLSGTDGAKKWEERYQTLNTKHYQSFRVYIESGLYDKHLRKYRSLFLDEQILVIDFDELKKNTRETLKGIFRFLEVDDDFIIPDLDVKNPYNANKKYIHLLYRVIGDKNKNLLKTIIPQRGKNLISKFLNQKSSRPMLSNDERGKVEEIFKKMSEFRV